MRTKFFVFTLVAVLALALSACGPAAPSPANQRTINVTGTGLVMMSPDIAYISIGVHTEANTAATAVAQNTTQTQKVIEAIKKLGVADADIRTINFSIWPNQRYDDQGQPTGLSYVVDNTVYLTVRDLSKMGQLIDDAVKAGANTVNSIQFDVADKTEQLATARKLAIENAKKQAEEIAAAAGVKLGDIQTISYYDSAPVPYYDYGKGGGPVAADMSVPVSPGTLQLTSSVNIVYFLK